MHDLLDCAITARAIGLTPIAVRYLSAARTPPLRWQVALASCETLAATLLRHASASIAADVRYCTLQYTCKSLT